MLCVFSSILAVAPAWLLILAGFAIYFYYTRRTVGAGLNPETRRHLDMLREAS